MSDVERGTVAANGLEFHYLTAGSGPLALCVHGFPVLSTRFHPDT